MGAGEEGDDLNIGTFPLFESPFLRSFFFDTTTNKSAEKVSPLSCCPYVSGVFILSHFLRFSSLLLPCYTLTILTSENASTIQCATSKWTPSATSSYVIKESHQCYLCDVLCHKNKMTARNQKGMMAAS